MCLEKKRFTLDIPPLEYSKTLSTQAKDGMNSMFSLPGLLKLRNGKLHLS